MTSATPLKFISFEGGEGAGKSTQIKLLSERLEATGEWVTVTREPGGTPGAEEIRQLLVTGEPGRWSPLTEALLNSAARADHVERVIRPALENGGWVITDRFFDSTMAYQGYAGGLGRAPVKMLNMLVAGETQPGLTVILDIDPEKGLSRAAGRDDTEDRFERKGSAFHSELRAAFHDIAAAEPQRCVLVDADRPVDTVAAEIWALVRNRFSI